MYTEGKYRDLHIETPTGTISAHKSVVCIVSPYLEELCQGEENGGVASTIVVAEDKHVIEAVLEHCYGLFDPELHDCSGHAAHEKDGCHMWMEIALAADKVSSARIGTISRMLTIT